MKKVLCVNKRRRSIKGNPPCYGCEERSVGCHTECMKYLDWAEKKGESKL